MKKFVIALTGLVLTLSLFGLSDGLQAAELNKTKKQAVDPNKTKNAIKMKDRTIIGTVNVTKDSSGKVSEIKLKTAKLDTYNITLNDKALKMAESMEGKNVSATGVLESKKGAKWLTVAEFEPMTAKPQTKKAPSENKPK
jgi:hypothetical protein